MRIPVGQRPERSPNVPQSPVRRQVVWAGGTGEAALRVRRRQDNPWGSWEERQKQYVDKVVSGVNGDAGCRVAPLPQPAQGQADNEYLYDGRG